MVTGVNRVTLIGRLGRDPETRGSEQNPVVLFSLATSLTLRDPDGRLLRLSAQASVEFGLCNSGLMSHVVTSLSIGCMMLT